MLGIKEGGSRIDALIHNIEYSCGIQLVLVSIAFSQLSAFSRLLGGRDLGVPLSSSFPTLSP
jgi:hypothetical protein